MCEVFPQFLKFNFIQHLLLNNLLEEPALTQGNMADKLKRQQKARIRAGIAVNNYTNSTNSVLNNFSLKLKF